MNKLLIATFIMGAIMVAGWAYTLSAQNKTSKVTHQTELTVSATIYPLYDLVRQVGGDRVEVNLVLPPGASPHTFDPTPQDIQKLQSSTALFAIGHGLDNWAQSLTQNAGVETVITLDKNLNLLASEPHEHDEDIDQHEAENNLDPHYWLSLLNAQTIVQNIADSLSALDPEGEATYRTNARAYQQKLDALYQESLTWQQQSKVAEVATFHNAWNYLAQDYDFQIATTFEPFPGEDPTPQDLQTFQSTIERTSITTVFAEPQLSSQALEAIANDLNINIAYLDPLGGTINRDTYLDLMRYNLTQIFYLPETL